MMDLSMQRATPHPHPQPLTLNRLYSTLLYGSHLMALAGSGRAEPTFYSFVAFAISAASVSLSSSFGAMQGLAHEGRLQHLFFLQQK